MITTTKERLIELYEEEYDDEDYKEFYGITPKEIFNSINITDKTTYSEALLAIDKRINDLYQTKKDIVLGDCINIVKQIIK